MNEKQRIAILKLIDEAERTYLALLDGPLEQGEYKALGRAIKEATEQINEAELPISVCPGCGMTVVGNQICECTA